MGEHIFKVALAELLVVRIKCKNEKCQAVTELPLDNIEMADDQCPVCETAFFLSAADATMRRR